MTFTEILPAVFKLYSPDKLKLIRPLADDLGACADIHPFEAGKVYQLPTPYNTFGAAEILASAIAVSNEDPD